MGVPKPDWHYLDIMVWVGQISYILQSANHFSRGHKFYLQMRLDLQEKDEMKKTHLKEELTKPWKLGICD
jgi:hypothetical protein